MSLDPRITPGATLRIYDPDAEPHPVYGSRAAELVYLQRPPSHLTGRAGVPSSWRQRSLPWSTRFTVADSAQLRIARCIARVAFEAQGRDLGG